MAIGGAEQDLSRLPLSDSYASSLRSGRYSFVFIAMPCKSFSVSPSSSRPLFRPRSSPAGLPSCPPKWKRYLTYHSALLRTTRLCVLAVHADGVPWVIENPSSRSDPTSEAFWRRFAEYGSLWDLLALHGLAPHHRLAAGRVSSVPGVIEAVFAACAFGADRHLSKAHGYDEFGASRVASAALYAPAVAQAIHAMEYMIVSSRPLVDMPTSLPVAERLAGARGDDVIKEIERLLRRYGVQISFHFVCGRSCQGCLCHGHELALLFERVAESTSPAPFPRERKPTVPEIVLVSDVKDFLNQHYLAPEECDKVGLLTLDLRAVQDQAETLRSRHPSLCSVAETKAFLGTTSSAPPIFPSGQHISSYPSDAGTLRFVTGKMIEPGSLSHLLALRNTCVFASVSLGCPDLTILGLRVWRKVTGDLWLTIAIVQKHGLGQQVTVQGFRFNTGLGIVFVPADKLRRALLELQREIYGQLTLASYQSLLVILESLPFV
ncbi:MAG: hypothetical protein SGPRY_012162, partial [Prymnesium sp.]